MNQYFLSSGFSAKRVAESLREETSFACGGGQLHVYREGVYRPEGGEFVHERATQILEDRWTRRRADEVAAYLLATSPKLLERPPLDVVNVRNGLLDIRTGTLREHTPEFLSPVQIGASFDEEATCPAIDKFVSEVFPGDAKALAYELPGHLMIPDTRQERAVMLLGGGSNGKSTYLRVVEAFLGQGANVSAVTLQSLDSNRFAAAGLYGKLANIVADLDAQAVKSSAVFKAIVSGDSISGERKYGAPFTFRPYARLLFSANEPPPTNDTSYAYFRRWIIVPFEATFAGDQRDKNLLAKLATESELSGFLNRALDGLRQVGERGDFTQPESLKEAAQEFRTAVDSAAAFVNEQCVVEPGYRVARPRLYEAYKGWCTTVTRSPLSARRFNERVRSLLPDPGSAVVTIRGTEHWQGITLWEGVLEEPPEKEVPSAEAAQGGEGVDGVEKVEERPTLTPSPPPPLTPEPGESRVETSSTFSTLGTRAEPHRCPGCRLLMSVARVSDVCGHCQAWEFKRIRGRQRDE